MGSRIKGFDKIREERKNLSFFKVFQSADLSSETMRAFPYSFITKLSDKDLSYKMVMRAKWGSSWEAGVSKNPRFYYMERLGWNQFVSDNRLGENEFVTFTHKGNMCFNVNIYEQNGTEMIVPRRLHRLGSSSQVKKEQGDKDAEKEEETCESPGVVHTKKIPETSKRKRVVNPVEIGESTGGVKRRGRKKKYDESTTSEKNDAKTFTITIRRSYLTQLAIPRRYVKHIQTPSKNLAICSSDGNHSWEVGFSMGENQGIFSRGWTKVVREYPLSIGDVCTFKQINPTEFLLLITKNDQSSIKTTRSFLYACDSHVNELPS